MEKTIVHPTDFSECANKALDYAILIAKALKLKIAMIHVVDFNSADNLERSVIGVADETQFLINAAEKKINELLMRVESQQVECLTTVCSGDFSSLLSDFVSENKSKMIVMGTTGKGSLVNKIMGSNTYRIIKILKYRFYLFLKMQHCPV